MTTSLVFPTITAPDYPLKESRESVVLASSYEDGSVQRRRNKTRLRKTFNPSWGAMTNSDKEVLDTFFETTTNGGALTFMWTHPYTNVRYEVYFDTSSNYEPELEYTNYWKVSLTLKEV